MTGFCTVGRCSTGVAIGAVAGRGGLSAGDEGSTSGSYQSLAEKRSEREVSTPTNFFSFGDLRKFLVMLQCTYSLFFRNEDQPARPGRLV